MKKKLSIKKILFDKPKLVILTDNDEIIEIDYHGLKGELTRKEWLNDEDVRKFNKYDQQEILRRLEMTTNGGFFYEG